MSVDEIRTLMECVALTGCKVRLADGTTITPPPREKTSSTDRVRAFRERNNASKVNETLKRDETHETHETRCNTETNVTRSSSFHTSEGLNPISDKGKEEKKGKGYGENPNQESPETAETETETTKPVTTVTAAKKKPQQQASEQLQAAMAVQPDMLAPAHVRECWSKFAAYRRARHTGEDRLPGEKPVYWTEAAANAELRKFLSASTLPEAAFREAVETAISRRWHVTYLHEAGQTVGQKIGANPTKPQAIDWSSQLAPR